MGCGVSLVTVSTYIGEVATHKGHGALGGIFQIMLVTGVFLSHGFSIPLNYAPGWRVLFAITGIPSLIQLGLFPFCVETPAYLISQGKLDQAKENLIKLRSGYDTTQEFQDLVDRQNKLNGGQKVNPYKVILNNKKLLKHMLICIMVHIAQQWCGINGILFYSATIFSLAFGKENAAYLALGTDAVFILFTLVFILIADRLSRKWLMIITLISTAICSILVTVGLKLAIDVMVAVFIFIFIAIFALGIGPIPWMIVSELFPSDQLPAASGVAMATNWLFNFIFTLVFPSILKQVEAFTFLIFAVIAIVFAAGVLFFVPETKGKTIDQLLEG
ncbi:MFS general substrate transporter [Neoconidiobolus thromboides FSU 785]|nr:MFS general substrate transporter [Neoconidiobolus thromboides FSU 785]